MQDKHMNQTSSKLRILHDPVYELLLSDPISSLLF